jgi:hypothetical protein
MTMRLIKLYVVSVYGLYPDPAFIAKTKTHQARMVQAHVPREHSSIRDYARVSGSLTYCPAAREMWSPSGWGEATPVIILAKCRTAAPITSPL